MLVEDLDDMIVKALSWAIRELIIHDPIEVHVFIAAHEDVLAARVRREIRNKLMTVWKNT